MLTNTEQSRNERQTPHSSVMNFLNEVATQFPAAVSLAAGRPNDTLLARMSTDVVAAALARFQDSGRTRGASLLQYGRTAGCIHDLVAQQLRTDAGIPATAERTVVTAGGQEALYLCLTALCREPDDVLLVCNPTYIGATGAALSAGVAVYPLPGWKSDMGAAVDAAVARLRQQRRRARALYVIPDFDNPTGTVLTQEERQALIAACARHRIAMVEDGVYRPFRYAGAAVPTMAELDNVGCVIHLASYAKTLAPALRIGAAVLPSTWWGSAAAGQDLFDDICQRKSFITVNTSQVSQAIVGGLLLQHNCTLAAWNAPAIAVYRENRNALLTALSEAFASNTAIDWNQPEGGFFVSLDLPIQFDAAAVTRCATYYGVIVMPMAFFALDRSQDRRVRLSFGATDPDGLRRGVAGLRDFLAECIA